MVHPTPAECSVGRSVQMPWPGWRFECDDPGRHLTAGIGTLCDWHYWDFSERTNFNLAAIAAALTRPAELEPLDFSRPSVRSALLNVPITSPNALIAVNGI